MIVSSYICSVFLIYQDDTPWNCSRVNPFLRNFSILFASAIAFFVKIAYNVFESAQQIR